MLILVQEISKNFKNHDENTSKIHPNAWEEGRGGKEKKKPNNRKDYLPMQCLNICSVFSHFLIYLPSSVLSVLHSDFTIFLVPQRSSHLALEPSKSLIYPEEEEGQESLSPSIET